MKNKTKRIHISLPAELVKSFDVACEKNYLTRSEAIKRLLLAIAKGKIDFAPEGQFESDPIGLPKNQCMKCGNWYNDEAIKDHICKK